MRVTPPNRLAPSASVNYLRYTNVNPLMIIVSDSSRYCAVVVLPSVLALKLTVALERVHVPELVAVVFVDVVPTVSRCVAEAVYVPFAMTVTLAEAMATVPVGVSPSVNGTAEPLMVRRVYVPLMSVVGAVAESLLHAVASATRLSAANRRRFIETLRCERPAADQKANACDDT